MVKICILLLLLAVTPNLHYKNYATTTVQSGLFLLIQDWTGEFGLQIKNWTIYSLVSIFFGDCRFFLSRLDCIVVQTGPDRKTVLRSSFKIWNQTAYKSVWSGQSSLKTPLLPTPSHYNLKTFLLATLLHHTVLLLSAWIPCGLNSPHFPHSSSSNIQQKKSHLHRS
jgi:hypothetical protein